MGKFSRNKGRRNEYALRDSLRAEGYEAERVPLSGASAAFKGDIKFTKEGKTYYAELKTRACAFTTIYDLYDVHKESGSFGIHVGTGPYTCVAISDSMQKALEYHASYAAELYYFNRGKWTPKHAATLKRVVKMRELKQDCEVLVIKDDRRPFLYITYR